MGVREIKLTEGARRRNEKILTQHLFTENGMLRAREAVTFDFSIPLTLPPAYSVKRLRLTPQLEFYVRPAKPGMNFITRMQRHRVTQVRTQALRMKAAEGYGIAAGRVRKTLRKPPDYIRRKGVFFYLLLLSMLLWIAGILLKNVNLFYVALGVVPCFIIYNLVVMSVSAYAGEVEVAIQQDSPNELTVIVTPQKDRQAFRAVSGFLKIEEHIAIEVPSDEYTNATENSYHTVYESKVRKHDRAGKRYTFRHTLPPGLPFSGGGSGVSMNWNYHLTLHGAPLGMNLRYRAALTVGYAPEVTVG